MDYTYRTKGTCSREISFELDGDRVKNVHFVGGCDDRDHAAGQHLRPAPHVLRRPAGYRGAGCL